MAKAVYLNDKKFLKALDLEPFKEQYIKITVLNFVTEQPLVSLEGKCTSGSCNLNGSSNVRRTASCSVAVDFNGIYRFGYSTAEQYHNVTEINNLISINKKVQLEIGFTNTLQELDEWDAYKKYDTIWFPLGVYVIKAASVSKNNGGVNISLTLNDKMALLNGDVGGTIPAATVFSESELFNATGTSKTTEKILIKDIIRKVVMEFGGELAENIIITDIPDEINKVMKWVGKEDIYLVEGNGKTQLSFNEINGADKKTLYTFGQDIGYMREPFVYPGTLECSAGEAVTAVLDKIKNALGNYEYFYDLEGHFVFQEIKNYLNTAPTGTLLDLDKSDFEMLTNFSVSEYRFDAESAALLTAISSSPQFPNIKNDFVIWGTTKTTTGADKPIRYHLAFQDKPTPGQVNYFALVYTDYRGLQAVMPLVAGENYQEVKPTTESDRTKYYYDSSTKYIYHWDDERECFRVYPDYEICYLQSVDWRTELYYQGLYAEDKTFAKQPYSAELNSEWTKIVDVKATSLGTHNGFPLYADGFRTTDTTGYEYWLELLEGTKFRIEDIGRRTKVISDKAVNCIFPVKIPEYAYINADGDTAEDREMIAKNQDYIQVSEKIFNNLVLGGGQFSAFEKVKELLYAHTNYNESISITCVPIYYLEPNTRITVCDNDVSVNGDYLIKSISLPLTPNGTSSISAAKIVEKTF